MTAPVEDEALGEVEDTLEIETIDLHGGLLVLGLSDLLAECDCPRSSIRPR